MVARREGRAGDEELGTESVADGQAVEAVVNDIGIRWHGKNGNQFDIPFPILII